MTKAATLDEALDVLDPRPLEFGAEKVTPGTDPAVYTTPPLPDHGERKRMGAMDRLRKRLLTESGDVKLFLSGHVGNGKSTELNRLAADPEIQKAFRIVKLRFEEQEWATLDSAQVLLRIASALFEHGKAHGLLGDTKRWKELLRDLDGRIHGSAGVAAKDGSVGVEIDLLLVRLQQELILSEGRRRQLREIGETQQSLLQDLVSSLVNDIEDQMAKRSEGRSLLLMIDDLDKVRDTGPQKDLFDTNLNTLLKPRLRILYTLPTGVSFGQSRGDVRRYLEHLYPVRVLSKAPATFDAEKALVEDGLPFFRIVLSHRVAPGLFDDAAVRLAAVYSGGVLRDFFHLLRESILIAQYNDLDMVDGVTMRETVRDARFRDSAGLYAPDWEALLHVHRTHSFRSAEDRHYLDEGRVLECYNDVVWFSVQPLLWKLLEDRAKSPAT